MVLKQIIIHYNLIENVQLAQFHKLKNSLIKLVILKDILIAYLKSYLKLIQNIIL